MKKKIWKKMLSSAMVLLMLFALSACSAPASSSAAASAAASEAPSVAASTAAPAEEKVLKVGMLLPGTINDRGWNASAYDGLMLMEKELGAEVFYSEKVAFSDFEEVFRGYASEGCDIVIGHGYEFGDAAKVVAPEFPDTMFVITSTDISQAPNIASLHNVNSQQGFLAGVVAGLETKSKVVGCVGGMEIPSIADFVEGFKQGAVYANPEVEVLANYTGNFDDVAKAKELAAAMIKQGADIITHDADQAGLGAVEAVNEAAEGVRLIGSVADQYDLAPDRIITSAMNEISKAILLCGQYKLDGTLEAKSYAFGIEEGVISLADFRGSISAENEAMVKDITAKIVAGEIAIKTSAEV